ncbi:MAG: GspE/PulE family protein [bacterium]
MENQNKNQNQKSQSPFPQWKRTAKQTSGNNIRTEISEKAEEKLDDIYRKGIEEKTAQRAREMGFLYADLGAIPIEPDALGTLEETKARIAEIAVIHKKGKQLKIAAANPKSQGTLTALAKLQEKGFEISAIFLASQQSLEKVWKNYANLVEKEEKSTDQLVVSEKDLTDFDKALKSISHLQEMAEKIPITEVLNTIAAGAIKMNASDIHLEPSKKTVRLRYRLDGVLQEICQLPQKFYPYAVSRIKMLAELKLNVSNIPQDGRITMKVDEEDIDLRVSSIPGEFGENFVMRILRQKSISLQFEDLGIRGKALEIIQQGLQKPKGMILVTGPTGSGKTTTLYSFLNKINSPEVKIITLEDPIEYRVEGIQQTQIDAEAGYTFASGLRAILRQDPDVILVGEIRDEETANIAIQAALTGHVVFSTIHTNDAPGAIPRLINLGVDPTLLEPAINGFIAQRLARRLCPECKEAYAPAQETTDKLLASLSAISPEAKITIPKNIGTLYRSKGCAKCNNIGYKGRAGIFEIFSITPEIEKISLQEHPSTSEIRKIAIQNGMITMLQDGILKAINGITTLEEVYRVTGE